MSFQGQEGVEEKDDPKPAAAVESSISEQPPAAAAADELSPASSPGCSSSGSRSSSQPHVSRALSVSDHQPLAAGAGDRSLASPPGCPGSGSFGSGSVVPRAMSTLERVDRERESAEAELGLLKPAVPVARKLANLYGCFLTLLPLVCAPVLYALKLFSGRSVGSRALRRAAKHSERASAAQSHG